MTSRERIRESIRHREPDRIPVDMGATPSSGISAIAYHNLAVHLQEEGSNTLIYDVVQELAQPEEWFINHFGIDALDIGRTFTDNRAEWYQTKLPQGQKVLYPKWFTPRLDREGSLLVTDQPGDRIIARKPRGASFFDQTLFPYIDGYPDNFKSMPESMLQVHWQSLAHCPWDHAGEPDFWQTLSRNTAQLRHDSDKALVVVAGCNLFEWGTFLRRMDQFLTDLYLQPGEVEALLDALMEIHLQTLGNICRAVGDLADIIRLGDDLGSDSGPFMNRETYQKYFKPRHRILTDYIKANSNMNTLLHTCGAIRPLIPDLIDAGFDILNPVQTGCPGMNPRELKNEFGPDITFWGGGIDTRQVLNRGTPGQVRSEVLKNMDIFSPGGGFVFNPIHNILPDIPPENIVAMFEAVDEFNGGPGEKNCD